MKTLLVVDDDEEIRESLKDLFQSEGFAVELASDGAQALAILRTAEPPALVMLDLVMPRVDGIAVVEAMRDDRQLKGIPVLITTANPSKAPAGLPVAGKPFDIDALVATVRTLARS